MRLRRFTLSFVLTSLCLSPLLVNARKPVEPNLAIDSIPPIPGLQGAVANVSDTPFKAEVAKRDGKTVHVRVTAENKTDKVIATVFTVAVLRDKPMPMIARMVPPPEKVAEKELAVRLAPGEKLDEVLVFTDKRFTQNKNAKPTELRLPGVERDPHVMTAIFVKPPRNKLAAAPAPLQ